MAGGDNDDAPEHAMIRIGPLQLDNARRQVFDRGMAVPLGGRAFEILLALVEARGALVTREDLLARVWGRIHVDDSTLRVHMSKLRRALACAEGGEALIRTESGRGYRLSAPVLLETDAGTPAHPASAAINVIPDPISSLIGRDDAVPYLADLVEQHRLVTLVGAGGIGKTRLAQAVANRLSARFSGNVAFVDLAAVTEPDWVAVAVSTALGKVVLSGDPTEMLVEGLKDSRALILLDNCEHLVEAAALLAEAIARGAPQVRMLSTSRESLRVDGEWVYRLKPLDVPAEDFTRPDRALGYSAVQLFVERAASAGGFALIDSNAAYVCAICRRLDGLPLAIEMAAVQAAPLGAKSLADQLSTRIPLEELGSRRTAISRHRTLAATLQWSHDLLSAPEQTLFRRLSVFAGQFSLEDAVAIDHDNGRLLTRLSAQSLLAVDNQSDNARFRMLDTTRRYATDQLLRSGEDDEVRRRHARYMLERLEQRAPVQVDDVRAALDWAFAQGDAPTIGTPLTLASVPLWWSRQLIEECRARVAHALKSQDLSDDPPSEMKLQIELFATLLQIDSHGPHMVEAAERARMLAESLDDVSHQLRATWSLMVNAWSAGRFKESRRNAEAFRQLGVTRGDQAAVLIGDRLMGNIHFVMGDQAEASRLLQSVLDRLDQPIGALNSKLVYNQKALALSTLAQVQFLRGEVDHALRVAEEAVWEGQARNDPVSEFYALMQAACPTAIFAGQLGLAEQYLVRLESHGQRHRPYANWIPSLRGLILIRQGDLEGGAKDLAGGIARLDEMGGISANHNRFKAELVAALIQLGRLEPASKMLSELERQSETNGESLCDPEILRLRAELLRASGSDLLQAEALLEEAIQLARRQTAKVWELRAANSLASIRSEPSRRV